MKVQLVGSVAMSIALSLLAATPGMADQNPFSNLLGRYFHKSPSASSSSSLNVSSSTNNEASSMRGKPSPSSNLSPTSSALPSTCSTTGPQRIAVIVATYPGAPYPVSNVDYLKELFLGTSDSPAPSVKDYYAMVSENKVSLDRVDFFGPYSFAQPYQIDSSKGNMFTSDAEIKAYDQAIVQLAQSDVHLENYDRLVLVAPKVQDSITGQMVEMAAGLTPMGCSQVVNDGRISKQMGVSWVLGSSDLSGIKPEQIASASIWNSWSDAQRASAIQKHKIDDMKSIVHEIGHTFGLGHANSIYTDSGDILPAATTPLNCQFYGDYYDVMATSVTSQLNIPHRASLGWLSDDELQTVTRPGTFRIYASDSNKPGLRGIKIPRISAFGEQTDANLWVEYRNGSSIYESKSEVGSEVAYDGALVHYTNPKQAYTSDTFHWTNETLVLDFDAGSADANPSMKDQMLRGTWQDRHSLIGLEVVDTTPDYLDVKVTFSGTIN